MVSFNKGKQLALSGDVITDIPFSKTWPKRKEGVSALPLPIIGGLLINLANSCDDSVCYFGARIASINDVCFLFEDFSLSHLATFQLITAS